MTTIIVYSLLASLAIMTISAIGVLFTWQSLGRWLEKNLTYLVAFSAGVFLYVAIHLIAEAKHLGEFGGWIMAPLAVGVLLFYAFDKILPESHHHHSTNICEHDHGRVDARKMLLGDAFHNIGDGIIIGPAFMISIEVGLVTTIAILIHEGLQEISEFFVLRQAGYSPKQALIRNLAVSSTILIGLVVGLTLSHSEMILAPLLAIAAGGFIYIVIMDLLPAIFRCQKNKKNILILIALFVAGALVAGNLGHLLEPLGIEHGHGPDEHLDDH